MKRFYLTMLMVILLIPCKADTFVIKAMNVPQIRIGEKICKVGSEFSSNETIHWSSEKVEIIEAQNTQTKKIWQFTKKSFKNSKSKNATGFCNWVTGIWGEFGNYFTNIIYLSTREAETYNLDEYSDMALTREFNLVDTINIDTKDSSVTDREYFAAYYLKGEKKIVPLSYHDGVIVFAREQFVTEDMELPKKLVLTVYYTKDGLYYEITNGMCVTIVEPLIEGSANFLYK